MKILKIIEKTISLKSEISNSYINFGQMTGSIVAVFTDVKKNGKNIVGYGFNSIGRYACTSLLRDRMIPKIMNADESQVYNNEHTNIDPVKINALLKKNEKPGGHGDRAHAIGALDMALWDTYAKIEDKPLYQVIGEKFNNGTYDNKIYTYAAGGYYYESDGIYRLKEELKSYLDKGFRDVKIKIGGCDLATDLKRIEAALSVVGNNGKRLMVDANGRFDLLRALRYAEALAGYHLKWYEEPLDPLDFRGHAALCEYYPEPIATGENLFSLQDLKNLLYFSGLRTNIDFIQMDPPLSYGLVEYVKVLKFMKTIGWSGRSCIPHGGNLFSNHVAAGMRLGGNECYPGVFQPLGGFTDGSVINDSMVLLPDCPGIGFEQKSNLWKIMSEIN
jgi:L-alanine-DL-glutamate epimerase-like enolase superfamily enzyme